MFAPIILGFLLQGQEITISFPADRISAGLKMLSSATGVKLEASEAMQNEHLILNVEKMPFPTLLQRIAAVTRGEWQKKRGGFILVQDPNALSNFLTEAEKTKRKHIADNLAAAKTIYPLKGKLFDQATAKSLVQQEFALSQKYPDKNSADYFNNFLNSPMRNNEPIKRLAARLAASLTVDSLMPLIDNKQIIFSTAPTPMEYPLPEASRQALAEYNLEQKTYENEQDAIGWKPGITSNTASKLLFLADSNGLANIVNGSIVLLDSSGMKVGTTDFGLFPGYVAKPAPKPDNTPVNLPSESKAEIDGLRKIMDSLNNSRGNFDQNTEFVFSKYLHPTQFEPLKGLPSSVLIAYSKATKLPLIGDLSDFYFLFPIYSLQSNSLTTDTVRSALEQLHTIFSMKSFTTDNGYIEIFGIPENNLIPPYMSRPDLENYLDSIQTGANFIRQKAAYASVGGLTESDVLGMFLGLIATDPKARRFTESDSIWWKFLYDCEFSNGETNALPRTILVSQLLPKYQNDLIDLIYHQKNLQYVTTSGRLPQESLPNGIPGNTKIQMTVDSTLAVISESDQSSRGRALTLQILAQQELGEKDSKYLTGYQIDFSKLRPCVQNAVRLSIILNGTSVDYSFIENKIMGPICTKNSLPQNYLDEIKKIQDQSIKDFPNGFSK